VSPDRVVITAGTSEGIELTLTALAGPGDEVLVPVPTYPLYTAVLSKIGARAVFYRTDPARGWAPDVDHIRSLITPETRALVVIEKLADGRLCSTGPMEHAIVAALNGDRSHQASFRDALRARAEVTTTKLNAIPGMSVVAPTAAFYAMPKVELPAGATDEQF